MHEEATWFNLVKQSKRKRLRRNHIKLRPMDNMHKQRVIFSFCKMKLMPGWSQCIAKRSSLFRLARMLELKPVTHHSSKAGSF